MPPPSSKALSSPFSHRELNGETLLDELQDLRAAGVGQKHLNDCALALRALGQRSAAEADAELRHLASARFQAQPELAGLLVRWAAKLKSERDVAELCSHFDRLALASALIGAMARGSSRLPPRSARR